MRNSFDYRFTDAKPSPLFECPDQNLIMPPPRVTLLQPQYHQLTIKQEPGLLDSPDIMLGYEDWQESSGDVSPKKELLVSSVKDQDKAAQSPHLHVLQTGGEIEIGETELKDTDGLYMFTPGELGEACQAPEENTFSPSSFANNPPIPVALFRHVTKGTTEVDVGNSGNALEEQTILTDSPVMRSLLTSPSPFTNTLPFPLGLYQRLTAETTKVDMDDSGNALQKQTILVDSSGMNVTSGDSNINRHENQIHNCVFCGYMSANKSHFLLHMKKHSDEKPFNCTECDYCCSSKSVLNVHMRTHTGEKPFKCSLCDYRAASKKTLVGHVRTHTGEKRFKCSLCDHRCTRKCSLVVHMAEHTGEKPFMCSLCDFRTASKGNLVKHSRRHSGEKSFKCSLCHYEFVTSNALVEHCRTHTGEKPFKCREGDLKFSKASDLTGHMLTHTGGKPFQCTECDYASLRWSNLNLHRRAHMGEKSFGCSLKTRQLLRMRLQK